MLAHSVRPLLGSASGSGRGGGFDSGFGGGYVSEERPPIVLETLPMHAHLQAGKTVVVVVVVELGVMLKFLQIVVSTGITGKSTYYSSNTLSATILGISRVAHVIIVDVILKMCF